MTDERGKRIDNMLAALEERKYVGVIPKRDVLPLLKAGESMLVELHKNGDVEKKLKKIAEETMDLRLKLEEKAV